MPCQCSEVVCQENAYEISVCRVHQNLLQWPLIYIHLFRGEQSPPKEWFVFHKELLISPPTALHDLGRWRGCCAYSFPWLIRKCFYDIKRWYNWKLCHISIFVIHIKYKATSTLWFSHAVVFTQNNLYIFEKKYLLRFYKMTLCCIWHSNMLCWPLGSWKSSLQKPNTRPIVNKANWMDGLSLYALLSFVAHIGDDSGKQHGLFYQLIAVWS